METDKVQINKSQYRIVFKSTALFGGVQVWQILINIVRSKLVAIILGPAGMGITGLLTSSTELIKSFTSFGISSSSVKFIAEANGSGDEKKLFLVISTFKKLMWWTGLMGMLGVILFSPLLSKSAFGDYSYTVPFILLSFTLLFFQLSSGYLSVLQGMRQLSSLAKASLIGSVLGVVTTIPLYYIWGNDGIVPALIISTATSLLINRYFEKKIKVLPVRIHTRDLYKEGKGIIGMGLAMTLSGILATVVAYILRIFISNTGGTSEVGLYTAGMTILTTYVGMVFTAMTTDYFPRLSLVNKDNSKCTVLVNQQAEMALLILGPILTLFIIFAPFVIYILYSKDFLSTVRYMQWASIGMPFKAVSWAISYLYLAKGDMKLFVSNEAMANIVTLGTSIFGYALFGLDGLGIAFLVSYILYLLIVVVVSARNYSFRLSGSLSRILLVQMSFIVVVFIAMVLLKSDWKYVASLALTAVCIYYSMNELNRRLDIKDAVAKYINMKKNGR